MSIIPLAPPTARPFFITNFLFCVAKVHFPHG
jgi:hypothetical protein